MHSTDPKLRRQYYAEEVKYTKEHKNTMGLSTATPALNAISDISNSKNEMYHFEMSAEFFPAGINAHEATVVEEHCRAKNQALGWPCCGRSGSSVLEFGFQLDTLVQTHRVDQT
jgi:hypothetical protein